MAVRLTMDVFSGLPNPSVLLDDVEGREIIARLRKATKSSAVDPRMRSIPTLGYRGVLVEQLGSATEKSLPAMFRVFDGSVMTSAGQWPLADPSIEDILCSSAGPFRRAFGMDAVFRSLEAARSQRARSAPIAPMARSGSVPAPVRCRLAPRYEPEWWNDGTAPTSRQQKNNCYNYATNHRTDTFARPGVGSGRTYPFPTRCKDVYAATLRDGLVEVPISEINKCPEEGHLVALVISPMIDFHFYRKGRDGFWSHKPGINAATNLDQDGKRIVDPRIASRGVYTEFCGLLLVLPGHIVIR